VGDVGFGRDCGVLGWVGGLACTSVMGSSASMGPVTGGGASRASVCEPTCAGSGSDFIGAPGGPRGASPVSPCISPFMCPESVAIGVPGLSPGAGLPEGGPPCAGASELDCAARGWKRLLVKEGGAERGSAGFGSRPCGGGVPG